MQFKVKTSRAGHGWSQDPGEIVEMSAEEAAPLLKAGQIVPVIQRQEEPETAAKRK